jgi:subtilase family serine protease
MLSNYCEGNYGDGGPPSGMEVQLLLIWLESILQHTQHDIYFSSSKNRSNIPVDNGFYSFKALVIKPTRRTSGSCTIFNASHINDRYIMCYSLSIYLETKEEGY